MPGSACAYALWASVSACDQVEPGSYAVSGRPCWAAARARRRRGRRIGAGSTVATQRPTSVRRAASRASRSRRSARAWATRAPASRRRAPPTIRSRSNRVASTSSGPRMPPTSPPRPALSTSSRSRPASAGLLLGGLLLRGAGRLERELVAEPLELGPQRADPLAGPPADGSRPSRSRSSPTRASDSRQASGATRRGPRRRRSPGPGSAGGELGVAPTPDQRRHPLALVAADPTRVPGRRSISSSRSATACHSAIASVMSPVAAVFPAARAARSSGRARLAGRSASRRARSGRPARRPARGPLRAGRARTAPPVRQLRDRRMLTGSGRRRPSAAPGPGRARREPAVVDRRPLPVGPHLREPALTNRTRSTFFALTPSPYGSAVNAFWSGTTAYGSWAASPASTVSSPVIASTPPCWNSTRQPVWLSEPTAIALGGSGRRLSMLEVPVRGADLLARRGRPSVVALEPRRTRIF